MISENEWGVLLNYYYRLFLSMNDSYSIVKRFQKLAFALRRCSSQEEFYDAFYEQNQEALFKKQAVEGESDVRLSNESFYSDNPEKAWRLDRQRVLYRLHVAASLALHKVNI